MNLREIVGTLWPVLPVVAGGAGGAGPNAATSVISRAAARNGHLVLNLGEDGVASVPLPSCCAELTPKTLDGLEGLTVLEAGELCLA